MTSGYIYVLAAVALWAFSTGILVRWITIPAFSLYSIGAGWGVLFLLVALYAKGKLADLVSFPKKTMRLMLGAGLGIAINNGLFFTAIKTGSVANAVLSHYLAPLFVVLVFGPVLLKEKKTTRNLVLALTGLFGLFVMIVPDLGKSIDVAIIYGTLSAVFFAFHTALEKRVTQTTADPLSAVVYKNAVPMVLFLPFAIGSLQAGITLANWFWLAVWGILVLGVSFVLYFNGIRKITATSASILSYGEPIGATILATFIFKEPVTLYTVVGGSLIIVSGIGVLRSKKS